MTSIALFTVSVVGLGLTSLSLFGWGIVVRGLTRMKNGTWPTTIGLGLSAVLTIGGVVNVARIAFAEVLWSIIIFGILFAILHLMLKVSWSRFIHPGWSRMIWIEAASTAAFIVIVIGFTIATQLPPDVFNIEDDLQKYFAHPVRQLQTGTLYGSPLSALGSASLGGIAFLQSFVLSIAPIEFINGVDAVFGLFLLMCLGATAGWRRLMSLPGALFAPLLIAVINPQYVNVSALFLGAALMATAVLLTADEREEYPPSALAVGLVYGGLVALKPTFALFVVLHLPLAAIAVSIVHGSVREGVLWALRTAGFGVLALSPWVILHLPHYLSASLFEMDAGPNKPEVQISIFSGNRLFYGYGALILIGLALSVALWSLIGLLRNHSNRSARRFSNLLAAAMTVTLAYIIVMLLSEDLVGYGTVRYSTPFLLGIVPVIAILSARKLVSWPSWLSISFPLALYLAAVINFLPSTVERCRQALKYHSANPLALVPGYIEYNRAALSPVSAQTVQKLQSLIPEREPFVALINQPYHFDFSRNPILDAEANGLATKWARLPPSVRYVIWEYQGFGVRTPDDYARWTHSPGWYDQLSFARALNFVRFLNAELKIATVIYIDDRFVVARLPP